jgi:hypothetical protein
LVATTASVLRPWPPGIRENKTDAVALHTPSVREFKKLACWFSEKSWRYGAEVLGCDNRLCVAARAARVREDRTYAVFGAPTSSRSSQNGRGQTNGAGITAWCGAVWRYLVATTAFTLRPLACTYELGISSLEREDGVALGRAPTTEIPVLKACRRTVRGTGARSGHGTNTVRNVGANAHVVRFGLVDRKVPVL